MRVGLSGLQASVFYFIHVGFRQISQRDILVPLNSFCKPVMKELHLTDMSCYLCVTMFNAMVSNKLQSKKKMSVLVHELPHY